MVNQAMITVTHRRTIVTGRWIRVEFALKKTLQMNYLFCRTKLDRFPSNRQVEMSFYQNLMYGSTIDP